MRNYYDQFLSGNPPHPRDSEEDIFDPAGIMSAVLFEPIRQAAYFAGVPLTVMALRTLIRRKNIALRDKHKNLIHPAPEYKKPFELHPINRENEVFFKETYDPISKSRRETYQELDKLMRDFELESRVRQMIEDEYLEDTGPVQDIDKYRRKLETSMMEMEDRARAQMLPRTDVMMPEDIRRVQEDYMDIDVGQKAKTFTLDQIRSGNREQAAFIELLQDAGVKVREDRIIRRSDGSLGVQISSTGLWLQEDVTTINVPKVDRAGTGMDFDPETAVTIWNANDKRLKRLGLGENGKAVLSTAITLDSSLKTLSNRLQVHNDTVIYDSGPMKMLLNVGKMIESLKRKGTTDVNRIAKEWNRIFMASYEGDSTDYFAERHTVGIHDKTIIDAIATGDQAATATYFDKH
ncbi:MAG: hypothetical protein DRP08_04535, partial [Candidatus Aenigmatarchaeota archaeon]